MTWKEVVLAGAAVAQASSSWGQQPSWGGQQPSWGSSQAAWSAPQSSSGSSSWGSSAGAPSWNGGSGSSSRGQGAAQAAPATNWGVSSRDSRSRGETRAAQTWGAQPAAQASWAQPAATQTWGAQPAAQNLWAQQQQQRQQQPASSSWAQAQAQAQAQVQPVQPVAAPASSWDSSSWDWDSWAPAPARSSRSVNNNWETGSTTWSSAVAPSVSFPSLQFPEVTTAPAIQATYWDVPAVSASTYPDSWTQGLTIPAVATQSQNRVVTSSVLPAAVVVPNEQAGQPAADLYTGSSPYNFNALYKSLATGDPAPEPVAPAMDYNVLYSQLEQKPSSTISAQDLSVLESKYGQQLSGDTESATARISEDGTARLGPAPTIVNGRLTGRPIVSYDFHGVIENCRGPRDCKVNDKLVRQLGQDALNNDIVIVTAGVPSGNDEIVAFLKDRAKVWKKIKRLYNSGSKWEIMADLGAVAHYDDLSENLVRINSRVEGLQLIKVDANTQRLTAWT